MKKADKLKAAEERVDKLAGAVLDARRENSQLVADNSKLSAKNVELQKILQLAQQRQWRRADKARLEYEAAMQELVRLGALPTDAVTSLRSIRNAAPKLG